MLKTLALALLPVLASPQVALADAATAATQTAASPNAPLITVCEGAGAPARDAEPCATYWADVLAQTAECMATGTTQREAYRHRYALCSHQAREKYLAASQ